VDKNLFKNNSVIGLRDPSKSFPVGQDVGVLKWRFQTQEETEIPLTSKYKLPKKKKINITFTINVIISKKS
jgi:hypothetical protein